MVPTMPPASRQYTLVGFSPDLDWRPLTFLKPISAKWICSACGLVRKTTALLPCLHVLCESCYEQGVRDGSHLCPLDGNSYEEKDVDFKELPAGELLCKEVKCWNEDNGCQYATAASGITEHFLRECQHHSVRCSKCSATVLCPEVCAHLRSDLCRPSTPVSSASNVPSGPTQEAETTSFRAVFERQADEISAYLKPMVLDISTHGDRLNEISHALNTLKETLRQGLEMSTQNSESVTKTLIEMAASNEEARQSFATSSATMTNTFSRSVGNLEKTLKDELSKSRAKFSQIVAATNQIKAEVTDKGQKALRCVNRVLQQCELQGAHCGFLVHGTNILEDMVEETGRADYCGRKAYLHGYCMSPAVRLRKQNGVLVLHGAYLMHKGEMDDVLQWPLRPIVTLTVIHPTGGENRVLTCGTNVPHILERPGRQDRMMCFEDSFLVWQELINDGYEECRKLRIKWEMRL
ncbi:uncharacterized protein LOC144105528 [Amblyomma americanum]